MKPALLAMRFFLAEEVIDNLKPFGKGNVNDTFLVTLHSGNQLVLQRINPDVFPDPQCVHHNMRIVTSHLGRSLQTSSDLHQQFAPLSLFRGKGGDVFQDNDGAVWRLVNHIPGNTFETISRPSQAKELGRTLGIFHTLLSTLDPRSLADPLPGFHHTPSYLEKYERIMAGIKRSLSTEEEACHRFIDARRSLATVLTDNSRLSQSIIHGDPKVANFVFEIAKDTIKSLIDLDTVRYGLLLLDIGDGLRSCCNPLGESPSELEEIYFDQELFSAWLTGYGSEAKLLLTSEDETHVVKAVRVIAFELGLRFMTDHLAGNRYFKILYPGHNLFRAQVQFQLVRSVENQLESLEAIVRNCFALSD